MSHASIPAEVRAARGLPDHLVRISVGTEHPDDLLAGGAHVNLFDRLCVMTKFACDSAGTQHLDGFSAGGLVYMLTAQH